MKIDSAEASAFFRNTKVEIMIFTSDEMLDFCTEFFPLFGEKWFLTFPDIYGFTL